MNRSVKAGMAETGAADINTRAVLTSGHGPKHKRFRGHIHSNLKKGAARPLPLPSASFQRSWLQLRAVDVQLQVIAARAPK